MKKVALIVAGGSGSRMNNSIPKQFIAINNLPVLMHTIFAFVKFDSTIEIVLVLPENQVEMWKNLCKKHSFTVKHKIVNGGKTRFFSVKNGLEIVPDDAIVFIHDGVRPLVSEKTIKNCHQTALSSGNALPVIPVSESVRMINDQSSRAVDRSKFFLVQTPQTFQAALIKQAYCQNYVPDFTDDSSVLEQMGFEINLVEGNRENIKITYPEDLLIAACLLNNSNK